MQELLLTLAILCKVRLIRDKQIFPNINRLDPFLDSESLKLKKGKIDRKKHKIKIKESLCFLTKVFGCEALISSLTHVILFSALLNITSPIKRQKEARDCVRHCKFCG